MSLTSSSDSDSGWVTPADDMSNSSVNNTRGFYGSINDGHTSINALVLPYSNQLLALLHQDDVSGLAAMMDSEEIGSDAMMNFGWGCADTCSVNPILYVSVEVGAVACCVLLLMRGANVNVVSMEGGSALHRACVRANLSLVRWLLEYGADTNKCHVRLEEDTPLLAAVACAGSNPRMAWVYLIIGRLLLEHGARVGQSDRLGITPLHVAVTHANTDMTKLLLSHGADINYQGDCVMSPLLRAIDAGSAANIALLLEEGVDVNVVCRAVPSPSALSLAVSRNNLPLVLDLLNAGAKPDLEGFSAVSPLHIAAASRRLVLLLLLLAAGGDVNTRSDIDRAPLLVTLVRANSEIGVESVLRWGANPDVTTQLHTTALWAAVRTGSFVLARRLLATGCCVHAASLERFLYKPTSPLQLALCNKSYNMVWILLSCGAHLHVRDLKLGEPHQEEQLEHFHSWMKTPRSLKQLCRLSVRTKYQTRLPIVVKNISYPITLKQYILGQNN